MQSYQLSFEKIKSLYNSAGLRSLLNVRPPDFILVLCLYLGINQISLGQEVLSAEEIVSRAYDTPNPNESIALLAGIEFSEVTSDTSKNKYFLAKAIAHGKLGNTDSSLYFVKRCIDYAASTGNDFYRVKAYNVEGIVWRVQGEHERALVAFQNAEEVLEESTEDGIEKSRSTLLGNIGGIFYQLGDYVSAKNYSKASLESAKVFGDSASIAFCYLRLAILAEEEDSLQLCLQYNESARAYFQQLGDLSSLSYVEKNVGDIHLKQGNYEKALEAHTSAKDYAKESDDSETYSHSLLAMAESHFQLGQLSSAKHFVNQGIALAEEKGYPVQSKNGHELRYRIYKSKENFAEALADMELAAAISDSLNSAEARERISELELKYESARKEAEITSLESEKVVANLEAEESRRLTIIALVGAVVLVLFLIVFYNLRLKKSRAERQSREQQYDALQKRYIELLNGPQTFALADDMESLNKKVVNPLTEREYEALKLGLEGKSNREIAEKLFVSESTVKFHLRNVYNKLGVANRKEALEYVVKSS